MIPDCENCEYSDDDGRCTAFVDDGWDLLLPCEQEDYLNEENR